MCVCKMCALTHLLSPSPNFQRHYFDKMSGLESLHVVWREDNSPNYFRGLHKTDTILVQKHSRKRMRCDFEDLPCFLSGTEAQHEGQGGPGGTRRSCTHTEGGWGPQCLARCSPCTEPTGPRLAWGLTRKQLQSGSRPAVESKEGGPAEWPR